ncbi:glycoside hydrolase family 78 protein [Daldinia caldariorum]|uniref:glycoside hydrolase family 78 protein n=1 Tax=Daldinia caldariorum TaxID=326644 RepID=UPI002008CD6C|nr:glycoside hydrolase family 78 protein [Daldinia caldariorum]KAI1469893.1 glycoside hydrolase family 78 protein [Daldinia caldariorum]
MAVTISQISFEHHRVALGIAEVSPRISWRFDGTSPNWTQSQYEIELSRHEQNQTGLPQVELFHRNSSDSVLVPWPTVSLASTESGRVRVRAFGAGDDPDTPWSDYVDVETGLLNKEDWSGAQMISANKKTEENSPHQPLLFRKEFSLDSNIEKARLYIAAYGIYEAHINGKRVGTSVLASGWQSYKHRLVYDTYDVTDLLLAGDNVLGITVGEGWYAGRLGFGGGSRNNWGDTLGTMALLAVTSNGETTKVKTDTSWTASTGAIITSEIYNGEVYDSTLEQAGWSAPGFSAPDTAKWIGAKELEAPYEILVAPDGPPIRRVEEIKLKEILTSPSGKTILDFGQNFAGWLRLTVKGKKGDIIKLVHTEVLENGEIATRPLRYAAQTDSITLSGQRQTWEPTFTYHGFRYVQVDGWPEEETPLNSDSVTAVVIHSDMEQTGYFECSDPLINKLHQNVRWSMKSNFISIPTDCSARDERLGWTGDSHAFAPTANFLYDTAGFWRGWLKDLHSEQVKGVPPLVVPAVPAVGPQIATGVWGDAVVANPFNTYHASGDLEALREQYSGAKAWLDEGIPRNEAGLWNRSNPQLGDWLDPLSPPDNAGQATTNSSYVADAYLVYVTGLVAEMASQLGLDDDKARFEKWAADLKTAFREAWVDSDGLVANETQTGLLLPLYFDIFESDTQANAAASRLEKIIQNNKYLVGTGFAGTHLLGLALTKYNLTSTFYKMLSQTTVPSWLYQVKLNATTTWERWDSLLPDGSLNPGEMLSFNHYSFGAVANWIHQVIGGLAPAEPGWKTVRVSIEPGGNITWAKTSYLSPYGKISTDWKVDDTGFHLVLEVPPNSKAEVVLPGEKRTLLVGSGRHTISDPTFHL